MRLLKKSIANEMSAVNQEIVEIKQDFSEEVFVEDNSLTKGVASKGNIVEHLPSKADCIIHATKFLKTIIVNWCYAKIMVHMLLFAKYFSSK